MDAAQVREAWQAFRQALDAYQERLRAELAEAAQEKDLARLTELHAQWRALTRLEGALQKVEKLLPPLSL
ncbi:MAG: hypothetical protein KatS3mg026_1740 [Bacteroidia bacterium]|nr:MAG: hypothetical protein KatS3mg026_1740 [Bacteroidia bacterium]